MFQILFRDDILNLFHKSIHQHYKGALQIVLETDLPATIIDYTTGEVVYLHKW